jgi:hypothetical protein
MAKYILSDKNNSKSTGRKIEILEKMIEFVDNKSICEILVKIINELLKFSQIGDGVPGVALEPSVANMQQSQ